MKPKLLSILASLLFVAVLFAGCSTVVPKVVPRKAPSLSSTGLDSGVLAVMGGVWYVNQDWVDRYNALIGKGWGKHFNPPIVKDQGIVPVLDFTQAWNGGHGTSGQDYSVTPVILADKARIEAWIIKGRTP